jgi:hypothetical protein
MKNRDMLLESTSSISKYISSFLIAILVLLIYLPLSVALPSDGLDPSWHLAISYGLSNGYQFGKDIVFTYGPFGALFSRGSWPGLFYFTFIYWLVLISVFLVTNEKLLGGKSFEKRLIVIAPLLLILSTDAFVFYIFFSIAYSAKKISSSLYSSILVFIALGILALSKFTFAVTAVFALIPLTVVSLFDNVGWRRHSAWIGFILTILLGWMVAKQDLTNIPAYVLRSLEVARGYSSGMSIPGPINELLIGFFLLLFLTIYLIKENFIKIKSTDLKKQSIFYVIQTLSLLFISWVAFKQGYVRHDGHVFAFIAFIGVVILTIFFQNHNQKKLSIGWGELLFLFAWIMLFMSALNGQNWYMSFLENSRNQLVAGKEFISQEKRDIVFKNALNLISVNYPLPVVSGTTDIISWDISRVLANNLNWKPRPVIQSYSAYTPSLATLNADHVSSKETAAENYFVNVKAIDGHIPLQDDPLVWPELIINYDIKSVGQSVHMIRRKDPKNYFSKDYQLKEQDGFWLLPNNDHYDFATLSAAPNQSFFNHIKSFLLKPSIVLIELKLADGSVRDARYVTSLIDTPFIVSPLVEAESDFALLNCFCDALRNKRVVAFRFKDSNGQTISPKNNPVLKSILFQDESKSQVGISQLQNTANIKLIHGLDDLSKNPILFYKDQYVANAHSPSMLSYQTDRRELELCFGVRAGAWEQPLFDGVRYLVKLSGNRIILDKVLSPSISQSSDMCEKILLPPGNKVLILETQSNGNSAYDWAYWVIK